MSVVENILEKCFTPAITITLSENVLHFPGMQNFGQKSDFGFSNDELIKIYNLFPPGTCEIINIKDILPTTLYDIPDAYILIIRKQFINYADEILKTMKSSEGSNSEGIITGVNWDDNRIHNKKIVENRLFKKLIFLDINEYYKLPFSNVDNRGTIYNIRRIPPLFKLNEIFNSLFSIPLYVEGTCYYNINECYTPMHQEKDRRRIINLHLGSSSILHFRWYHQTQQVSDLKNIQIDHGDLYIMTDITMGNIKDSKTKLFLKHSMGTNEKAYLK